MKTHLDKLILISFLFFTITVTCQSLTRKVLFLGNSYTYVNDLPQIVSSLATNTGDVLIYDSNLIGGYTLQDHFASNDSKDKILSNNWDYIVLQEQSQRPAYQYPIGFFNGFSDLRGYIKQNKPCAQVTSFMTWGHLNGDIQNCPMFPPVCTYNGMQNLITDRYMTASDSSGAEVTPVGEVWKYIKENYPTINLYQSDGSHPSLEGSYLAACCFYTSLFRKDPTQITNNYGLDATTASVIRNVVKTIVYDQMLNWYIGKYVPSSNFYYKIGNGINEVIMSGNYLSFYKDSFIWDFGDGTTSTTLNPTHNYATNGSYTIKLTSYKCYLGQNIEAVLEKIVNFCAHSNTVYPNDLILCPNETDTIWTQPADSYQWLDYFGNPIAGATNQSIEVPSGAYSVLTSINGCIEQSPQIVVDGWVDCNLSVIDVEKPEIFIFPNPVENVLNIQTNNEIKEVIIYNLLGEKIDTKQVSSNTIDLTSLLSGVYIIRIRLNNDKVFLNKLVKK